MDVAYDRITDEALAPAEEAEKGAEEDQQSGNINTEFQEAFKAVSASPWGATLGGWIGEARKQGQAFYTDLQKEASEAQEEASKRLSGFREQLSKTTGGLNFGGDVETAAAGEGGAAGEAREGEAATDEKAADKPESLSVDIVKEAGTLVASLRSTAAARLKDLQRAEDAADDALVKFGTNVRDFLRDAVVVTAPTDSDSGRPRGKDSAGNEVLFETQEPGTGRKIFHSTRLDAQLHAIHSSIASFTEDPQGDKWQQWQQGFDIDKHTSTIAQDLDKYAELRSSMEKLVPEKVEYRAFWMRYYFLREAVDEEERRRKEVLKGKIDYSIQVLREDYTDGITF